MDSNGDEGGFQTPGAQADAEGSTAGSAPSTDKKAGVPGRRRRKVGVEPGEQTQVKYQRIVAHFFVCDVKCCHNDGWDAITMTKPTFIFDPVIMCASGAFIFASYSMFAFMSR
jgi:hypothetical protein